MAEFLNTSGIVLKSSPVNDFDRRVVILTEKAGKIAAFANGARKQGSRFAASTDLFVFADFSLYAGRNAFTIREVNVKNYFGELRADYEAALYGMYFLEVTEKATVENGDDSDMLVLLYQTLRALTHPVYSKSFVRTVFELKTVMVSGMFNTAVLEGGFSDTLKRYAEVLYRTPAKSVYSYGLKEEFLSEAQNLSAREMRAAFEGYEFKSLEMLKTI